MAKRLYVTPNKCIGCRTCEITCSFVHSENGKLGRTRISIIPTSASSWVPYLCLQCVDAQCRLACPVGALNLNRETGAMEINERCISCGFCQLACPFGHIFNIQGKGLFFKCDLCEGDPKCAAFCPSEALSFA